MYCGQLLGPLTTYFIMLMTGTTDWSTEGLTEVMIVGIGCSMLCAVVHSQLDPSQDLGEAADSIQASGTADDTHPVLHGNKGYAPAKAIDIDTELTAEEGVELIRLDQADSTENGDDSLKPLDTRVAVKPSSTFTTLNEEGEEGSQSESGSSMPVLEVSVSPERAAQIRWSIMLYVSLSLLCLVFWLFTF